MCEAKTEKKYENNETTIGGKTNEGPNTLSMKLPSGVKKSSSADTLR
jgi:hypothetical protein